MTKSYPPGPPDNSRLRSILALVDIAINQSNVAMLEHINTLSLEPNIYSNDLSILINGSIDEINHEDKYYRPYDQEDISIARRNLEREAYGNFNEAMEALYQDLLQTPDPSGSFKPLSDTFKPDLFDTDEEDLKIWNMMRDSASSYKDSPYDEELDEMLSDGATMIRNHQEKYYGPAIPVIIASYVKKTKDKPAEGHNVKLWYDHPTLNVETNAPFYEKLDVYFKKSIKNFDDFKPDNLPQIVGEYELDAFEEDSLFGYELNNL